MTHFLRNNKNITIIESEIWNKKYEDIEGEYTEVSSSVMIPAYSEFLLNTIPSEQPMVIKVIDSLDELRGWLWESYYMTEKNDGTKKAHIEGLISEMYDEAASRLGLYHVTD